MKSMSSAYSTSSGNLASAGGLGGRRDRRSRRAASRLAVNSTGLKLSSVKKYLHNFYYCISQTVITLSGRRFITVSGVFVTLSGTYYIIGRFYYIIGHVLQYRAFITLSVGTSYLQLANLSCTCSLLSLQITMSSANIMVHGASSLISPVIL